MRYRWMYQMTGLPGWMRFGFSPGWVGRSPTGLGPCAEYILTGRWPTPAAAPWWGSPGWTGPGFQPPAMAPETELSALETQADWLKSQLDAISKRIEELEKET